MGLVILMDYVDSFPSGLDRQKGIRLKVFSVLKKWVEDHYSDFEEDQELRDKLKYLLETKLAV